MKLVINLLLFITAIVLSILLFPLSLIHTLVDSIRYGSTYRRLYTFFLAGALSIDIAGNIIFQSMLNAYALKKNSYHFGVRNESISSAFGKNQCIKGLTWFGIGLASILDLLEKDHCWISINDKTYYDIYAKPEKVSRFQTIIVLILILILLYLCFKFLKFFI